MNVYTQAGQAIALVEPPVKTGGEGAIYQMADYPGHMVKRYRDTAGAQKREEKIVAMARLRRLAAFQKARVAHHIAWPLDPLYDGQGRFVGFVMDKVPADRGLDALYAYPAPAQGGISTQQRIDALLSVCEIMERFHSMGQAFGDLNPNNIKVDRNGSAWFVDADSFHIRSDGREYRCVVCGTGYVAPEVLRACKGTTYADCPGQTFTRESDLFALAVHIFRMLMNGCHPFTCRRQTQDSTPAPSSDQRVLRGETPFFTSVPGHTVPKHAPDLQAFPPYLQALFRRAFVDGHGDPRQRPGAGEWKRALEQYRRELKATCRDPGHAHWKNARGCPYCAADRRYRKQVADSLARYAAPPAPMPGLSPRPGQPGAAVAAPVRHAQVAAARVGAATATLRPKPVLPVMSAESGIFWGVTIGLAAIVLALMGTYVLPPVYIAIADEPTLTMVGTMGGCLSGLIGTVFYDLAWAPGRTRGWYRWYEYLLAVLAAPVFAFGFGVAMALVLLALFLFFGALILILFFGMLFSICTGG